MLEVFKRRWKPKRASNNNNNNNNNNYNGENICHKTISDPNGDVTIEKILSAPTSIRQIHPLDGEKAQLVAYSGDSLKKPVPYPPSICNGTLSGCDSQYSVAPNICVEGGRIEFIKPPPECADFNSPPSYSFHDEKEDCIKECLEARIMQLEETLDVERKAVQKERLINSKLQRQLSRLELVQRDMERERRLRRESEVKLRATIAETERYRGKLNNLQKEFSRMEDTVRSMLEYKSRCEQLKQAKVSLALSYENQIQHFQAALAKLSLENERLKKQLRTLEATNSEEIQLALIERLKILEKKNVSLVHEAEKQRKQYEHYLDDIASQVVRALLAQKNLREEIEALHLRTRDLETQNRALTTLLLQQMRCSSTSRSMKSLGNSSSNVMALPSVENSKRPLSLDEAHLQVWEEAVVWLPLRRPHSLSLNIITSMLNHECKKDEESPESGNRDEGYSTMSSDMQGTVELPRKGLEDVKEASDEAEVVDTIVVDKRLMDYEKSDMFFIPLNLSLNITNSRHSYPPMKDFLPYHHIMRSFSDSHLSLKFPASPTAPIILSLDPIRPKNKIKNTLLDDDTLSCNSSNDWWDSDYIQQWLRIDDTRNALQQRMAYDTNDIEDWSMEQVDETEFCKKNLDVPNPLPNSLPCIQDSEYLEFIVDGFVEDDENLWSNENKYFNDTDTKSYWPNFSSAAVSPGTNSWSSNGTNSEDGGHMYNELESNEGSSKRSSAVLSSDSGESSVIGTDFTRDFYRLVKFESTKSLTSISSRSQTNESQKASETNISYSNTLDREQTLQSVLNFISEQQHYCRIRELQDSSNEDTLPKTNATVSMKESDAVSFKNETEELTTELKNSVAGLNQNSKEILFETENVSRDPSKYSDYETISFPALSDSRHYLDYGEEKDKKINSFCSAQFLSLPKESSMNKSNKVCKKRPVSVEILINDSSVPNSYVNNLEDKENLKTNNNDCKTNNSKDLESDIGLKNYSSKINSDTFSDSTDSNKYLNGSYDEDEIECLAEETFYSSSSSNSCSSDVSLRLLRCDLNSRSNLITVPEEEEVETTAISESLTSNVSSPDTVICKGDSPIRRNSQNFKQSQLSSLDFRSWGRKDNFNSLSSSSKFDSMQQTHQSGSEMVLPDSIVVKNGQRFSFNESASSKDVIDELNRMIRKGEESSDETANRLESSVNKTSELDEACCCPTGWVHVERDIDFTDPKARANLLDVMLASRHSSSSTEDLSSCESEEEHTEYHHLHRIHRFRRQRKAAIREPLCGALRYSSSIRPSIIGRDDFYVRYGEKERDAVSSFDFLEEFSTTSLSAASSCESNSGLSKKIINSSINDPQKSNQLSLSDSCATSFSESD